MRNLSAWELIVIGILMFVIFGGRKLPELGRSLGKALANFRQAVKEPEPSAGETVSGPDDVKTDSADVQASSDKTEGDPRPGDSR